MGGWLKRLASEPNQVGSPHDKANAEWVLAQFKSWGWDAHIETFEVLYPTPIHESARAAERQEAVQGDAAGEADPRRYQRDRERLRASRLSSPIRAMATSPAPVVYVNYGMPDDYDALAENGRQRQRQDRHRPLRRGWRGLKPKLAQEHGAVGCIIYSDPHDDGYAIDSSLSQRPDASAAWHPARIRAGHDALSGRSADAGHRRHERRQTAADRRGHDHPQDPGGPDLLCRCAGVPEAMGGQVVPQSWRGSLPITYRVGLPTALAHLVVKSDWGMKTIYDVVAVMNGSTYPDQWVMRGNHHDGWVFGRQRSAFGSDRAAGRSQSAWANSPRTGWKPKRTIVYTSWDGEEPGLLGSTEWAETHADELKKKGRPLLNSDSNGRGFFGVEGSQDLEHLVTGVIDGITDPETCERRRALSRQGARRSGRARRTRSRSCASAIAKIAADPEQDVPHRSVGFRLGLFGLYPASGPRRAQYRLWR